jgi:hypothetical protein
VYPPGISNLVASVFGTESKKQPILVHTGVTVETAVVVVEGLEVVVEVLLETEVELLGSVYASTQYESPNCQPMQVVPEAVREGFQRTKSTSLRL